MQAFFSATDTQELEDQALNYEYFLSLIVNHSGEYCAKVSFVGNLSQDLEYTTKFGILKYSPKKEQIFVLDCEIELEEPFPGFKDRLDKIKPVHSINTSGYNSYTSQSPYLNNFTNSDKRVNHDSWSPYNNVHSTKQLEIPNFVFKNSEYLLNKILGWEGVNILNIKLSTDLEENLFKYESTTESIRDEIIGNIDDLMEDIIGAEMEIQLIDPQYENKMIEVYTKCINILVSISKNTKERNGFIKELISLFVSDISRYFTDDNTYSFFVNSNNLMMYYHG